MIFVISDDKTLEVVNDPSTLNGAYEGIDVEDGSCKFFDQTGHALKPIFDIPNSRGHFAVKSGRYHLVPDEKNNISLIELLDDSLLLDKNKCFKNLDEIRQFLTKHST
jgi:hypothetical protein